MRPLDKLEIGQKVRLDDGEEVEIPLTFAKHRNAIPLLLKNFGNYCSYCECYTSNGMNFDVEHIEPQVNNPNLILNWDNFLLACRSCNGSGGKWRKDIPSPNTHLPDKNNTFLSLKYEEAGVVRVNPELNANSQRHAQELIDWLKLDKSPTSSYKDRDGRCEMRRRIWDMAENYLRLFESSELGVPTIIDLAKGQGCWSIWFTVFKDHEDVRRALVEQFPGTARNCFDEHFNPVPRHPENTDDPI